MPSAFSNDDVFGPLPARRAPADDRLPMVLRAWVIVGLSIGLWVVIVEGLAWLAG